METVATSGKSGEGIVLQMHGIGKCIYAFLVAIVLQWIGARVLQWIQINYEDFGAIGNNVDNEN